MKLCLMVGMKGHGEKERKKLERRGNQGSGGKLFNL